MEMNINGPEDTKINIEEFDLNEDYRTKFKEKCQTNLHEYELKMFDDINRFERETRYIVRGNWETLSVKPKSIYVSIVELPNITFCQGYHSLFLSNSVFDETVHS